MTSVLGTEAPAFGALAGAALPAAAASACGVRCRRADAASSSADAGAAARLERVGEAAWPCAAEDCAAESASLTRLNSSSAAETAAGDPTGERGERGEAVPPASGSVAIDALGRRIANALPRPGRGLRGPSESSAEEAEPRLEAPSLARRRAARSRGEAAGVGEGGSESTACKSGLAGAVAAARSGESKAFVSGRGDSLADRGDALKAALNAPAARTVEDSPFSEGRMRGRGERGERGAGSSATAASGGWPSVSARWLGVAVATASDWADGARARPAPRCVAGSPVGAVPAAAIGPGTSGVGRRRAGASDHPTDAAVARGCSGCRRLANTGESGAGAASGPWRVECRGSAPSAAGTDALRTYERGTYP
mmetsp:Transcript_15152/g.57138  ORF Transcript_15152/g.57138 Transcript_15152/m.57138 type:complete len:368 (+) Transcript_15152:1128-2231(+)